MFRVRNDMRFVLVIAVVAASLTGMSGSAQAAPGGHRAWIQAVLPVPSATAPANATLAAVACPTKKTCLAIGADQTAANQNPFLTAGFGTSWSPAVTMPAPADSTSYTLVSIACGGRSLCVAVGSYTRSNGLSYPLVEQWNGRSWTVQPVALPGDALQGFLRDVSCASATTCVAVGDAGLPFVATLSGATWSSQLLPLPPEVDPATDQGDRFVAAVSCVSATECTAVGDSFFDAKIVVYRLSGTTWTATSNSSPGYATAMRDVACLSATRCFASGHYTVFDNDDNRTSVGFGASIDGTTVTSTTAFGPAGAEALAISCADGKYCLAAYGATSLVEVIGASGAGAGAGLPAGTSDANYRAVVCTDSGACVAVGSAMVSTGDRYPAIATLTRTNCGHSGRAGRNPSHSCGGRGAKA